jgi:ElaB/YqjD/DUF883 family membrane-anchored ribosome-binding protein
LDAEDKALKKIMKSALTADILAADKRRDRLYRGMIDLNRAALIHFKDDVQEAAKRLKILFDTYGNVAKKPLNEETSAIHNLLQELNGKFAQDVVTVGIAEWVFELKASNQTFNLLIKDRYEETAMRTDLVLKDCRQKVDDVYRAIVERVNAYVVIEGETAYKDFISNMNAVITKYHAALMRRHQPQRRANHKTKNDEITD